MIVFLYDFSYKNAKTPFYGTNLASLRRWMPVQAPL